MIHPALVLPQGWLLWHQTPLTTGYWLQSAQHVRSHWFWRRVAYPGGVIPDEDKPPRSEDEKTKDGKPAVNGTSSDKMNGKENGKSNGQVHDPTAGDLVSRSHAA